MRKGTDIKDIPKSSEGDPSIQLILGAGTCGLSSFSSAFYQYFNKSIATEWMKNTNGFLWIWLKQSVTKVRRVE